MTAEELLALPDEALGSMYSEWSEATWCAGWMAGGAAEFVEYVLSDRLNYAKRGQQDYERETLSQIRALLTARSREDGARDGGEVMEADPRASTLAERIRRELMPVESSIAAREQHDAIADAVSALEAEAARLREDKARLDWLEQNGHMGLGHHPIRGVPNSPVFSVCFLDLIAPEQQRFVDGEWWVPTLRAAVSARLTRADTANKEPNDQP